VLPDPLRVGELGPEDRCWLHPTLVDAVARRPLELAESCSPSPPVASNLLMASEVGERFHVKPTWVHANQSRLGPIRLGDGPKARLRFDARTVEAELHRPGSRTDNGHQCRPDMTLAANPGGDKRRRVPAGERAVSGAGHGRGTGRAMFVFADRWACGGALSCRQTSGRGDCRKASRGASRATSRGSSVS
jgi:hypothetical protein